MVCSLDGLDALQIKNCMFKSEERRKKRKNKIAFICYFPFNKSLGTAIF